MCQVPCRGSRTQQGTKKTLYASMQDIGHWVSASVGGTTHQPVPAMPTVAWEQHW